MPSPEPDNRDWDAYYRIVLPYAVFRVDAVDGVITDAAPIARWMRGKTVREVARWVDRKRGTMEPLG